jgi:hypothetical protein
MNREVFLKYLSGKGAEFGALHNPLPLDPARCQVLYVDRITKAEALRTFPELQKEADRIVEPDIVLDVDGERLLELAGHNLNFIVANHLIEHLVNPLLWLERVTALLPEGGILYLAAPIRERTFDQRRALTSNEHLWADYRNQERELSVDHLNDFLLNMTKDHVEPDRRAWMYFENDCLPDDRPERERIYAIHRARSIHVHVWSRDSFEDFLNFAIRRLALPLSLIDATSVDDDSPEMIFVLKRMRDPAL